MSVEYSRKYFCCEDLLMMTVFIIGCKRASFATTMRCSLDSNLWFLQYSRVVPSPELELSARMRAEERFGQIERERGIYASAIQIAICKYLITRRRWQQAFL